MTSLVKKIKHSRFYLLYRQREEIKQYRHRLRQYNMSYFSSTIKITYRQ